MDITISKYELQDDGTMRHVYCKDALMNPGHRVVLIEEREDGYHPIFTDTVIPDFPELHAKNPDSPICIELTKAEMREIREAKPSRVKYVPIE